jgi:hypothetical protein
MSAPVKDCCTFGKSAQNPTFEESAKFLQILRADVLKGTNALAAQE